MTEPEQTVSAPATSRQVTCPGCGAFLRYAPGTLSLVCDHCGSHVSLPGDGAGGELEEKDLLEHLQKEQEEQGEGEARVLACPACGAEVVLPENLHAGRCPYCGESVHVAPKTVRHIAPQGVLPFGLNQDQATERFRRWVSGLWFAPSDLKRIMESRKPDGVYLPHWTLDAQTLTRYIGERGDAYWVSETYTDTDSQGKSVQRVRQVRHVRWSPASGEVGHFFDDLLICASRPLPNRLLVAMEPWNLKSVQTYRPDYLMGFQSHLSQVPLDQAWDQAQQRMVPTIESLIRQDIGGDEQRIHSRNTAYNEPSFKQILLPLWLSAFRYRQKAYRFVVNGQTGKVKGERPYSIWKILGAIAATLVVIALIAMVSR